MIVTGWRPDGERRNTRATLARRPLSRWLALALVALSVTLIPRAAEAESIDPVDVAVEAGAAGGMLVGINISGSQKAFIKGLVGCLVSRKDAAECGKEAAINVMMNNKPEEAKRFATCIADGRPVRDCVTAAAIGNLPEEAQPIVRCIVETGEVGGCAQKAALNQIGGVLSATQKAALANLKEFGVDNARAAADNLPNFVKNLIAVAEGVRDSDYQKILTAGGAEVVKATMNVILNIILTPALAPMIAPIVDAVVQNRVDLFNDIVNAAKRGNAVAVGEIVMSFYATTFIEAPCALAQMVGNDFHDATCGNLAKIISMATGIAGDIAKVVLGVVEDVLSAVGVWQIGEALFGAIGDALDGKDPPSECGSTAAYFAANHLACLETGANYNNGQAATQPLFNACLAQFDRCYKSAGGEVCGPMETKFKELSAKLNSAYGQGANAFATTTMTAFATSFGKQRACDTDFWQDPVVKDTFVKKCEAAVRQKTKVPTQFCRVPSMSNSVGDQCGKAYDQADKKAATSKLCVIGATEKFRVCNNLLPQALTGFRTLPCDSEISWVDILRVRGFKDPGLQLKAPWEITDPIGPYVKSRFGVSSSTSSMLGLTGGRNLAEISPGISNAMSKARFTKVTYGVASPSGFSPGKLTGGTNAAIDTGKPSVKPVGKPKGGTNAAVDTGKPGGKPAGNSGGKLTGGTNSTINVSPSATRRSVSNNSGSSPALTGGRNTAMDRLTGDGRGPSIGTYSGASAPRSGGGGPRTAAPSPGAPSARGSTTPSVRGSDVRINYGACSGCSRPAPVRNDLR
jgi:hypothetical protein